MRMLTAPGEPNHVHLVWAVRRVTSVQAKYIEMFYGLEGLSILQDEGVERSRLPTDSRSEAAAYSSSQA